MKYYINKTWKGNYEDRVKRLGIKPERVQPLIKYIDAQDIDIIQEVIKHE